MDGEKVEIKLRDTAHGMFNCGADIEQFHIKKNTLAHFRFELIGQCQTAASQHAEADFVEVDRIPEMLGHLQGFNGIWHIHRHNQFVISHGSLQGLLVGGELSIATGSVYATGLKLRFHVKKTGLCGPSTCRGNGPCPNNS